MNEFNDTVIREQVHPRTDENLTITRIKQMEAGKNNKGESISPRDHLERIYSIRLRSALRSRPHRTDIHALIRSVLTALEALTDDEPIFIWNATTPSREIMGMSAPSRLILFGPDIFPEQRNPNDRIA
jgi:hypothetical protein